MYTHAHICFLAKKIHRKDKLETNLYKWFPLTIGIRVEGIGVKAKFCVPFNISDFEPRIYS